MRDALAEGRGGEGAGAAHAGLPRAQTDRALKEVGLAPALGVPEPNTWRDLLSELDRKLPVAGKRVAVQEYGARNEEVLAGLRQRGARVTASNGA